MARAKRVPFGPKKVEKDPSKPLSISAIKTTGTLVVLCSQVLLCSVVVCCCVLLCVVVCKRGGEVSLQLCSVRRYSGGGGWLSGLPLPSHYSVGIHGCMLVGGGGGCYSYITFDPTLAVSLIAHTTHR